MSEELKTCPFCGGKAYFEGGITVYWIKCRICGVETLGYDDEADAVDAWNRRDGEQNEKN